MRDLISARLSALKSASYYNFLDAEAMRLRRKSDRVFIFGSGFSINEIAGSEWAHFRRDDTMGFSGSIYMDRIPLDFLLLRAWTETTRGSLAWQKDTNEVLKVISCNRYLDNTVFALQSGLTAVFTNRLIGKRLWLRDRATFCFLSDKISRFPHTRLEDGLVHGKSTLCSAISLAVALGYKKIVLVGVDLYDSRYFWLPADQTLGWSEHEQRLVASTHTVRGAAASSMHNTAVNGIVDYLGGWRSHLERHHGVVMSVYNPRSLLRRSLPLFSWEA